MFDMATRDQGWQMFLSCLVPVQPGWHKLRDRATGGLRPSLSCEAEILIIQNDLWNKRGRSQRNGPILAYFTRRVKLYSMITYIGDTVGLTQWNPALYNGWLHQIVSRKENTAHSVAKYRNTRFEAEIFRKTTVWGRHFFYASLTSIHWTPLIFH